MDLFFSFCEKISEGIKFGQDCIMRANAHGKPKGMTGDSSKSKAYLLSLARKVQNSHFWFASTKIACWLRSSFISDSCSLCGSRPGLLEHGLFNPFPSAQFAGLHLHRADGWPPWCATDGHLAVEGETAEWAQSQGIWLHAEHGPSLRWISPSYHIYGIWCCQTHYLPQLRVNSPIKKGSSKKTWPPFVFFKAREKKTQIPQTTPQTFPSVFFKQLRNLQTKKPLTQTPLDKQLLDSPGRSVQAEILPLLLRVLKALKGGSCDARRKAAERCLAELEAAGGLQGEDGRSWLPYLGLIFFKNVYYKKGMIPV